MFRHPEHRAALRNLFLGLDSLADRIGVQDEAFRRINETRNFLVRRWCEP